jgi:hypothetical protein
MHLTTRRGLLESPNTVGVVAQLVEHHNGIVGVRGSNPLGSTIRLCISGRRRVSGLPLDPGLRRGV